MKKIAIFTTGLSKIFAGEKCGGGEILLKNLIFELIKMPDINLFIFTPDKNELAQKVKKDYPMINFLFYSSPFASYKYIDEVKEIAKTEKFDKIINYNMFIPYETTLLQCHSFFHRVDKSFALFRPLKKLFIKNKLKTQKKVFDRAKIDSDYIAVSQTLKEDYTKNFNIPKEKVTVAYPGVTIKGFTLPEKNDCLTFGIVANSSLNKGGHYLIFALGLLKLLGRKFRLNIIAPKYKKDIFMQFLINIFGLKKCVEVLPFQKDMTNFYNNTDVVVLPSINEAFGLVTLEAMERGKPCIVSYTAGSAEIITGKNGFVFNRNSLPDFIQKLDKMITTYNNNFSQYIEMSKSARSTAEKHSWHNFAAKVIE